MRYFCSWLCACPFLWKGLRSLSMFGLQVKCPICLGIISNTRTFMECMHRFCAEVLKRYVFLQKPMAPLLCLVKLFLKFWNALTQFTVENSWRFLTLTLLASASKSTFESARRNVPSAECTVRLKDRFVPTNASTVSDPLCFTSSHDGVHRRPHRCALSRSPDNRISGVMDYFVVERYLKHSLVTTRVPKIHFMWFDAILT